MAHETFQTPGKVKPWKPIAVGLLLTAILGGLGWEGFQEKKEQRRELQEDARAQEDRVVEVPVIAARPAPAQLEISLPGSLEAARETSLFARVGGYLKSFHGDLGDPVKAAQKLAEIDAPETDQDLLQAQADLGVAQAALVQASTNAELSAKTAERWKALAAQNAVPQQDADEKIATAKVQEAMVLSAQKRIKAVEAQVARLGQLQKFEEITAPFDGVITARNTEIGALVTAGGGNSRELFHVSQIDPLRLFIRVPEVYAPLIHPGIDVELSVPAFRDRLFNGQVTRTASTLDPASRTLLTEVRVPNAAHDLLPGMYVLAKLKISRKTSPLMIPSEAILNGAEGPQVARVDSGNRVHFVKIQPGRDYGAQVEIISGLSAGDQVVINPTNNIQDSQSITPRLRPDPATRPAGERR